MTTQVIPAVVVQEILDTNDVTGVAPVGASMTDSEETLHRGRYRKYESCDDGGEVLVDALAGNTITSVSWNLPGLTAVDIYREDDDGVKYLLHNSTSAQGTYDPRSRVAFVPPGWKIRVIGTGTLSADGRLMVTLGDGWGQPAPSQIGSIGRSARPPGLVRS